MSSRRELPGKLQVARREIKGLRSKKIRALRRLLLTLFIKTERNNTTLEQGTRSLLVDPRFSISNETREKAGFWERGWLLIKEKSNVRSGLSRVTLEERPILTASFEFRCEAFERNPRIPALWIYSTLLFPKCCRCTILVQSDTIYELLLQPQWFCDALRKRRCIFLSKASMSQIL